MDGYKFGRFPIAVSFKGIKKKLKGVNNFIII